MQAALFITVVPSAQPAWVFPSLTGTPLEERNVRHVLKRVLERAGLRHIRIHDLRHTYATPLLQAGRRSRT